MARIVGKRIKNAYTQVTLPHYSVTQALPLLQQFATARFDESVDMAINLNVDVRRAEQQVRGFVVLPHGTGRNVRVAVFTRNDAKIAEAKAKGAEWVGAEDLFEKIQDGFMDFDYCVASPDMMALVGRLGKVLGPRGLMPNPKLGTVSIDVGATVEALKKGQITYKTDKTGIVHAAIGKVSFSQQALSENIHAFIKSIVSLKPVSVKSSFIKKITLASTMGPAFTMDMNDPILH